MKKNRLFSTLLLTAGATAGTELFNKYIKMNAISRNLLSNSHAKCYKWRLGNIHYTKTGSGKPLLLIHDLDHCSSGMEWENLLPLLKEDFTVYTIDLLGCGRSEKPNLTYTNFLYVQMITDFIKSEIGRRTSVIATGGSASLVTMACAYDSDLFDQLMFINPDSFASCSQVPGKRAKCYKFLLDMPIIGTLLYHIASSKDVIQKQFTEQYFYNPYKALPRLIDKYYESAHRGLSPNSVYSSVCCHYTKCNISRALAKIDNSIYILGGSAHADIHEIIEEYTNCNPAIESSLVAASKYLPQLEKPAEVEKTVKMFFH